MFRSRLVASLGLILALALSCAALPAGAAPRSLFFPETGQLVADDFLQFWSATPRALQILGYPISAPFLAESTTAPGQFLRVQYFERAVLEEHLTADGRIVVLGRLLGNDLIANRRDEPPFRPVPRGSRPGTTWDDVTRHTIGNAPAPFKRFYDEFGGLRVFGRPTSEQFQERNPDTGAIHWVQYFERQRLEWHPEAAPGFQVMLGRLGDEYRLAHPDRIESRAFLPRAPDASPPRRFEYGMNATLFYTDQPRALRLVTDAGFGWVRQQVHWKDHQSADRTVAWGELDAIVAAAEAAGVRLLLSVTHAPDWATGLPGVSGLPTREHIPDYAAFVGALAQRYAGRVQAYEIWNEINLAPENAVQPVPAPAYYVEMLHASAAAIKAADSQALIVSTPLAPTEWAGDPAFAVGDLPYSRALFADARFWAAIDAVGVHVFGCANPPDALWPERPGPGPGWSDSREFYFRRVEDIRRLMVESGHGNRPIWITEFGWATANNTPGHEFGNQVSAEQQARYIVEAIEMGRTQYAPWIGAMFVWNLNFAVAWHSAGNPQHQMAAYGILNPDWSPRPAYLALQRLPK